MIPTSPSSTSSYDLLSPLSCSSVGVRETSSDSDDEIVWLQSSDSSESSLLSDDDDDFVVLSGPRSPAGFRRPIARPSSIPPSSTPSPKDDELSCLLSEMSLCRPSSSAPIARPPLKPTVTNALVLRPPITSGLSKTQKTKKTKKTKKARKKAQENETVKRKKAAQPSTPAAELPITGDASVASVESMTFTVSKYEEAASFMTSFLSSPATRDSVCKLTLLQSLILELGLQSSALPGSLTAARALLKNRAHVNIREYIVARQQGQSALKEVLHPSRSALVKSIRKNKNPASLKWVKSQGLQVLLVNCFR